MEYMIKNPPQHDAGRFTNLVSTDHGAIATYLEFFLHELRRYNRKWNFQAVNNMVWCATKTARTSYKKKSKRKRKTLLFHRSSWRVWG